MRFGQIIKSFPINRHTSVLHSIHYDRIDFEMETIVLYMKAIIHQTHVHATCASYSFDIELNADHQISFIYASIVRNSM